MGSASKHPSSCYHLYQHPTSLGQVFASHHGVYPGLYDLLDTPRCDFLAAQIHLHCSGGARWHDRLFDILQKLNFKPSMADPDVWMRPEPGGTCYEYIAVYVDDLAIAAKDPQAFCNELKKRYNLKLKGVGPLEYHLGCTYKKDPDGTLAADPRRYVNKILESYERMFNEKPRKSRPPLEGGDHPELDPSELCDVHQTKQFQTLIGQLQ